MTNLRTSGVFSLGSLSSDNAFEAPSLDLNFDGQLSSFTRATTSPTAPKANGDQLATEIVTQNKTGSVQSKYMGPNGKLISGHVENLLPHSSVASWTQGSNMSVTASSVTDPFGGTGAFRIDDQDGAAWRSMDIGATVAANTWATLSIYIHASDNTSTKLGFNINFSGGATFPRLTIVNGVPSTPSNDQTIHSSYTGTVTQVAGTDWYRWEIPFPFGVSSISFYPAVAAASSTGYVTVFGAQLELGGAASQLVQTSGATASAQVPRVEFDASGNPLGLLVEESRTNTVPNTEMLAYTGSYTSLRMANTGNTVATNAGTAPDGTTSATLITPGNSNPYFAGHAQDYTAGTTYTFSYYVKVPSGSTFDGQVGFILYGAQFNSGGGNLNAYWHLETDGTASFDSAQNSPEDYGIVDAGNGWYRVWITHTCTNSGTARVQQHFRVRSLNATNHATDTLLQWGAQVEEGAGPTSLIAANSTRTADDITLATSSFGFDINNTTVLVDATLQSETATGLYPRIWELSGSSTQRLFYRVFGGNAQLVYDDSGNDTLTIDAVSSYPYAAKFASAHVFSGGSTVARTALNGVVTSQTVTSTGTGSYTQLSLGGPTSATANYQTTNRSNGHIRRFTYWPRAISDVSLASYTSATPPTELVARTTRKWGGMTGRSLVSGGNVEATGVLSLAEHYQVQLGITPLVVATGGTYVEHDGYSYNVFYFDTSSTTQQTLTIPTNLTQSVDVLMVAGGGGGGYSLAAGGGAGGMVDTTLQSGLAAGSYTITVGGGGAGGVATNNGAGTAGANGANTTFTGGSLSLPTANGGGGGGSYSNVSGQSGGSGGGNYANNATIPSNQTGTDAYGNAGASATGTLNQTNYLSGGGGGAGGAGVPATLSPNVASAGGVGRAVSWIPTTLNTALTTAIGEESGGAVYFAGGGGGCDPQGTVGGLGGLGGGGVGGGGNNNAAGWSHAGDGQAHTGGGGGGGDDGFRSPLPGVGGSGIVVIRYTY